MKLLCALALLAVGEQVAAQQVYIPGSATHIKATAPAPATRPTGSFAYTLTQTTRTATPAPKTTFPSYGKHYNAVSSLFSNQSTTTWGNWSPSASSTASDSANKYGQSAWTSLWTGMQVPVGNFTRGLYSTTVSPTPVPKSELVLPPPRYFTASAPNALPKGFMFGVAGSAAQIEGAIADEGRSPALPDLFLTLLKAKKSILELLQITTVEPDYTTVENYYLYKQDILRLAAMGVRYYSLSISWARILPFVLPGTPVNQAGIDHYNDLINFALANGIQPVVTLLHLDTPVHLYNNLIAALLQRAYYGFINAGYSEPRFQEAFVNYGKIVMSHFGDRVPVWITINEPGGGCTSGKAVFNVIYSHAQLHHFYKEELGGKGQVSMKMGSQPGIPLSPNNASHVAATEHYNDFNFGPFLNPTILGTDYPDAYKETIQDYIPLNQSMLAYMNGTMDFLAYDGYGAQIVYPVVSDISACASNNATTNLFYPTCVGVTEQGSTGWLAGEHPDYIFYDTAPYLRTQLSWLWHTYGKPIAITEFGLPNSGLLSQQMNSVAYDSLRSDYYLSYMTEITKSVNLDGVNVMGALMWSFIDNWEFGTFQHQFGVQGVNLTTQERFYKRSFFDVMDFVQSHS